MSALTSFWEEKFNNSQSQLAAAQETNKTLHEANKEYKVNVQLMLKENAAAKDDEKQLRKLLLNSESETKRLRAALEDYGSCGPDCACCPCEAGEPTKEGGYRTKIRGKWYATRLIDERPKCDCGFIAALDGGKA